MQCLVAVGQTAQGQAKCDAIDAAAPAIRKGMNATLPAAFISCILSLMGTLSVATGMVPAAALTREQCRLLRLSTLGDSPKHTAKLADWVRPEKPACIAPSEPMISDLRPKCFDIIQDESSEAAACTVAWHRHMGAVHNAEFGFGSASEAPPPTTLSKTGGQHSLTDVR